MKLWKVFGIVFGLYGLIGPWLIGAAGAGSHTGGPSWLILFASSSYTFIYIIKFFGWWGPPTSKVGMLEGILRFILVHFLNVILWLLMGAGLGFFIQKIKEMIK